MTTDLSPAVKSTFPSILSALLACALPAQAFPTAGEPGFAKLFEARDEIHFTAGFGKVLLEIPAAEIPAFRESLVRDLEDKKIPQTHAFRARRLTDTRWAETDTAGFLAAIRAGLKDPHHSARLRAACLLLDSDIDAAIQAARDSGLSYGSMEPFSVLLAAKDPQRAFALFTERAIDSKTSFSPVPMFLHWAEKDADAAWTALNSLGDNPRLKHYLSSSRTSVSAHLARRDLPTALRLIDSLDHPHAKTETTRAMIATITKDDIPAAHGICRKLDTKDAWIGFARAVRTPDDRETIRILLESLPAAHREEGLAAFFSYDDPVLPAFRNAQLIPLLEDPVLRRKALLDLVETHMANAYKPMPDAVIDAALAMTADILGPATPLPQRQHLLRQMLGRDPMAVLPWILSLSDAEYASFQEDIRKAWPDQRLAKDIPTLLAHTNPRAQAIGTKLLDDGLWSKPADVLATAIRHAPERIAKEMNVYTLHKQMADDFPKAEAQLREIADPSARAAALRAYALWSIGSLPPAQAKAMAQEYIQKNPKEDPKETLSRLAMRQEEEFDDAISAIPSLPEKKKDEMRGLRARGLLLKNEEIRALRLLKDIRSDDAFFSTLYSINNNGEVTITRWDEWLSLIAARPNAHKQKDVIDLFSRMLVKIHNEKSLRFVARISNMKFRESFATAVNLRIPPTKDGDTWERAMKLGLATEAGRTMGIKAIRILANQDPKSAIQALLKSGQDAMRPEFVQPVMEKLIFDDPAAAFALFQSFSTQNSGISISNILNEWVRIDPQAACNATLTLNDEGARHLAYTVGSWFKQDADAARSWVFSLPQGPARQAAVTSIVQVLSPTDSNEAAKLLFTEFSPPLPDSLANRIAWNMSQTSYPAACQFLVGLEGKIEVRQFSNTWQSILRDWFASDPDAAGRFLSSLPDSAFTKELRTAYPGASRIPDGDVQASDPLQRLRNGTLRQQVLSEKDAAGLRQAVIQPANQAAHLADYCVDLLRRNQDAAIPAVLKEAQDLAAQQSRESGYNAIPNTIAACMRQLQQHNPQRLPAFLDSLAAVSPEWLETAVATLWSPHFRREGYHHPITPLMASSLLRVAPEKRAKLIAGALFYANPLPEHWIALLTTENAPGAGNDPDSAILLELAKSDLASALRRTCELPQPQADPLVRAILAAFPSRDDAAKAIRALPPAIQPRVAAWHDALNPQAN